MATWNGSYLILNPSAIISSTGGKNYAVKRLVSQSAEARRQVNANRYRRITLSGLELSPAQHEELQALADGAFGMEFPILAFDMRDYLLETSNPNGTTTPAPLGTGTGASLQFQLRRQVPIQGRAGFLETINFPNWGYPPFTDLSGGNFDPLPQLQVYANGVPQSSGWTVDVNTGIITTNLSGALTVTGAYLWKFLFPNNYSAELNGTIYKVSSGVELLEPFAESD